VQKGDAAPLEAELLQVELNRDLAQRALTEGRARRPVLQLQTVLDVPASRPPTVGSSLTPPTFSDDLGRLKTLALCRRPLRLLRIAEEQAGEQTDLARVETKLNITLSGQYSHADSASPQYGLTASRVLTPIRDHDDLVGLGLSLVSDRPKDNHGIQTIPFEGAASAKVEHSRKWEWLTSANVVMNRLLCLYLLTSVTFGVRVNLSYQGVTRFVL
jgi:hypothetical protein